MKAGSTPVVDSADVTVLIPGDRPNLDTTLNAAQANFINGVAADDLGLDLGAAAGMTRRDVLGRLGLKARVRDMLNDLIGDRVPFTVSRGQYTLVIDRVEVAGSMLTLWGSVTHAVRGEIPISWPVGIGNPPVLSEDPAGDVSVDFLGPEGVLLETRKYVRSSRQVILDVLTELVKGR